MKLKKGSLMGILFLMGMGISLFQDIQSIDWFSDENILFIFYGAIILFVLIKSKRLYRIPKSMRGIDKLSPIGFEHFIKTYLLQSGFAQRASVTQASYDWGADVMGVDKDGISFVVQCKHSTSGKRGQGKRAVEEAITARQHYGVSTGICVTNTHFTKQAKVLAQRNNIRLIERCDLKRRGI